MLTIFELGDMKTLSSCNGVGLVAHDKKLKYTERRNERRQKLEIEQNQGLEENEVERVGSYH